MNLSVHDAIDKMRDLSKKNKPFSFSFSGYSETSQSSAGIVDVTNAKLIKRIDKKYNRNAEIMEAYMEDGGDARHFYQPLLLIFNGQKVELT